MPLEEKKNSLGYYVLNSEETLLRGVWVAETIKTEGTVNSNELKMQRAEERKKKFMEKKRYGQFSKEISDSVDKEKSWY